MGVLITMTRTTASPAIRPHSGGEAEILFFTGVRYYRMEDDEEPAQLTHSRRRAARRKAEALKPGQQV